MGRSFTSAQRTGGVQRGGAAVQRFHGGIAEVPSLAGRWHMGRGRVDGSLSICSGGSDAGSSYEATKRVRMAGTGLTVRSIVEEFTVGRTGRAPTAARRWARVWGKLWWG